MNESEQTLLSQFTLFFVKFYRRRRWEFLQIIEQLKYMKYSWRVIILMLHISPKRTIFLVLSRLIDGFMPSVNLHIKGEFIDLIIQDLVSPLTCLGSVSYRTATIRQEK